MKSSAAAVLAIAALVCLSCGRSGAIVVGSKNFTEQEVLGEIAAQQIEARLHTHVERRFFLGGTLLAHLALKDGQIDLYPEYTGTALSSVLKEPLASASDSKAVYDKVASLYKERFHLIWMPPLGFDDTFAMAVRREDAKQLSAQTLSAAVARSWRLGVGYEFLTRPDGLRRLNSTYRLRWNGLPKTMDLGLLYRALNQHQIDMAAANSTDGLLTSNVYAVLKDDRRAFPPYQACFVVREDILRRAPGLRAALDELSGSLDEATMRQLNRRVDIDHVPVVRVAADFLAQMRRGREKK
ncbi:MAG TPA: glycine betaine ABC transporter substrate-binding protein [Bryobacteraceae bacterium]|nr:glycine betaine ABC transporter substrate-binding protein [Bryobacteraceae bacterium]